MMNAPAPMNGPRYDEFITVPKVRVIDQDGENLGVLYTKEAIATAQGKSVPGFVPLPIWKAAFAEKATAK